MNTKRLDTIRQVKLELKGVKFNTNQFEEKIMENPCQDGYIAYGTKEKDGRIVPNCVPEKAAAVKKEGFPVPSPSGDEDEQGFIGRCMSEISGEYEQSQALAICYSKWKEG